MPRNRDIEVSGASDAVLLQHLGRDLAGHRLRRDQTQAELAREAGVSRATVQRVEAGQSVQLLHLVRILRALGLGERLAALVPDAPPSPLAAADEARRQERRRASRRRPPEPQAAAEPWRWGDEP